MPPRPRRATTKKVTKKTTKSRPSKQSDAMKKMASDLKKAATTLMRHSKQLRSTKK